MPCRRPSCQGKKRWVGGRGTKAGLPTAGWLRSAAMQIGPPSFPGGRCYVSCPESLQISPERKSRNLAGCLENGRSDTEYGTHQRQPQRQPRSGRQSWRRCCRWSDRGQRQERTGADPKPITSCQALASCSCCVQFRLLQRFGWWLANPWCWNGGFCLPRDFLQVYLEKPASVEILPRRTQQVCVVVHDELGNRRATGHVRWEHRGISHPSQSDTGPTLGLGTPGLSVLVDGKDATVAKIAPTQKCWMEQKRRPSLSLGLSGMGRHWRTVDRRLLWSSLCG